MAPREMTNLEYAYEYARLGLAVLPLHAITSAGCSCPKGKDCTSPGKHPRTKHGVEEATAGFVQIKEWWTRWPQANIGIATGKISGKVVLDVDADKGGFASLDDLQAELGQLPDVPRVLTGGGGWHLYFDDPEEKIGNRGAFRPGIDFRGDGGYVVAPPSLHASGKRYEWDIPIDPESEEDCALGPLEALLREKEDQPKAPARISAEVSGWDYHTPEVVLDLLDANEKLDRIWRRDKRLKTAGDASSIDFAVACALIEAGIDDLELVAHGVMASRYQDPDAWAKVAGKSQDYFGRTVSRAAAKVEADRDEVRQFKKRTHEAFRDLGYPWNEKGNADRFLSVHGQDLLYHVGEKRWLVWDGRHFAGDQADGATRGGTAGIGMKLQGFLDDLWILPRVADDPATKEAAEKFVRRCGSAGHARAIQSFSADRRAVVETMLDVDPHLLNAANGVVDLATGEVLPHDRRYRMTQVCGCEYLPGARSEEWERLLEESLPDETVRDFLQLMAGYSLLGEQPEQIFTFLWGPSRTGKSTVMKALEAATGCYHRAAAFETFLDSGGRSGSGPTPDLARLARARIVSSLEASGGRKLNEGLIKQLSGGDTVTARKLHADEQEWRPVLSLWLVANDRPKGRVDDDALWRRLRPVAFEQVVDEAAMDTALSDRMRAPACRPAVLAWMVEGAKRYLATRSLALPEVIRAGIDDYRASGNPLREFYEDSCWFEPETRIRRSRLWDAYRGWCSDNEARTMGKRQFFSIVGAEYDAAKIGGFMMFLGVGLNSTAAASDEEIL